MPSYSGRRAHRRHWRRRATTLPTPSSASSSKELRGLANFTAVMKQEFSAQIKTLNRQMLSWGGEPDPWDEAIKSIERRQAAKEEWPWPTH